MRVSVCMAVYNGELFIYKQINSILSQLTEADELIISDDGSTDRTLSIIQNFNSTKIKLLHNVQHGFVSNFENALRTATGQYIFLSDQDDIWFPNKLETSVRLLQQYKMVVHNAQLINQDDDFLGKSYFDILHKHTGFLCNLYKTRFLGCCMAFRSDVLQECLPFPKNIVAHDYWLGMYVLFKYPKSVLFVDEELIQYRRHGNNVSSSSERSHNSFFYKIVIKRYSVLMCIVKRYIYVLLKRHMI